jgi:hypothetical protein
MTSASIRGFLAATWTRIEAMPKWAVSVLSEPNGNGSASRVCFLLVTTTVCGVLAGHLYLRHSLPDAGTIGGLSGLLTAGAAGYGANKITTRDKS